MPAAVNQIKGQIRASKVAAMPERVKEWGPFILLGAVLAMTVIMLFRNGIFGISETFSDEHDHYKRSLMFAGIVRGKLNLDTIGTFYSGGIWPPFYPMVIGTIQALTNAGVGVLRGVNVLLAYGGCGLLIASVPSAVGRYAGVVIVTVFSLGTHYYYQIRPENLVLLLVGMITFVIIRHSLFASEPRNKPRRGYALCGALCAIAGLTHAFLAIFVAYLAALSLIQARQRLWFIIALSAVAGPYVLAQSMIHNGVVILSTTAEENLARNNNSFLRDHDRPQADDMLFAEMEKRYQSGDKIAYPRPLVLPDSRYGQWLHDENKRRIFKEIAVTEIRADPSAAAGRAWMRVVQLIAGEGCLEGQRYGCNIGMKTDRIAFHVLEILALVGLIIAARRERAGIASFSFVVACCALLAPMIATQSVERQFIIVLMLAAFGGLVRPPERVTEVTILDARGVQERN